MTLLGSPGMRRGDSVDPWPAERRFQLLSYLACVRDWVDRERLAALFWPDHDGEAAYANLRKVIYRARGIEGLQGFEAAGTRVRWPADTDVAAFDAAIVRSDLAAALDLYRGPLLDGLERGASPPYLAWLQSERQRLALAWRQAALARIGTNGDAAERLRIAQSLLSADPFDEDALAAGVQAHRALGAPAAAEALLRGQAQRLATEFGVEPSARIRALDAAAGEPATERRADRAAGFVGRRLELREIAACLRSADAPRLLLLHGPGGVGKSRLAREALHAVGASFADGAHWIALEDLNDAAEVAPRVAQVLGLQWRDGRDALGRLVRLIGDRAALLVFDNAEHLPALQDLLAALIGGTPRLRLLVTSRARLEGAAHRTVPLAGLDVPDDESADAESASAFDAVRLFTARASFHVPSFRLAPDAGPVIDIVRQVQGLPLAIEMAAAWVRLLPPHEIARELRQSIDILARDADRAGAGRAEHASMQATIDRSWSLLAPAERDAMACLAVFVGGFTREAAQAVAGVAIPLLASLADKSLVQPDRERARFDLHPLVAAYARQQAPLHAAAVAHARQRHVAYFAAWLARIADLKDRNAAEFTRKLDGDLENCRAAWLAAVSAHDAAALALMALPLAGYLGMRGRYEEAVHLLARARTLPEDGVTARRALAHVHRMIASMYWNSGRQEGVREHAHLGIRHARAAGDVPSVLSCLCTLGLSREARNQARPAERFYRIALRTAEAARDRYWIANACINLAGVALQAGKHAESLRYNLRALQIHRETDNVKGVAKDLNNVGNHYRVVRDWERAERYLREGLELSEHHGLFVDLAYLLVNLGLVEQERGAFDAAVRCFERTLALRDRGANPWLVTEATYGLARVAARRGDAATARRHLADGLRLARAIDHEHYLIEGAIVGAEVLAAEGDTAQARALCQGVVADPRSDATLREDARLVLDRLPAGADASAALSAPAIDALLDRIVRGAAH